MQVAGPEEGCSAQTKNKTFHQSIDVTAVGQVAGNWKQGRRRGGD